MNSFVAIAYVPDTETRIKIAPDGRSIDESEVKWIVSPYDEYGLEEALRTKEAKGAGTVRVAALGPERAKTGLRECLARGADEAVWIDSGDARYLDALATAKVRGRNPEGPPPRQACKLTPADDPAAAAKELVRLLREEAKVI